MKIQDGCFTLYGNALTRRQTRQVTRWREMFVKKFNYDETEKVSLRVADNPYLGAELGIRDVLRIEEGEAVTTENTVVVSTIRMGFGHYRIAMAGASAARAMGFTPLWLDLLQIPGITSDVINWCNTGYSRFSRRSQASEAFNRLVWESVTTGNRTLPGLNTLLNAWIVGWPWRFLKTNIKDYMMSSLFRNMYSALPRGIPMLTAHMWNCMGAVSAGMTNVVDMMFDNWPMAFQLTEGAKHAVQSPSGYYGFRAMRGFDEKNRILKPTPPDAIYFTGHHVDHELVENVEHDCAARLRRVHSGEPRRFMITMGGAGAQKELFKAVIEHCIPMIMKGEVMLLVNLGDHRDNWDWIEKELTEHRDLLRTHFTWEDTRRYADEIRESAAEGLHVFLHDNTFHAVYATNYLMRVVDVLVTKPSELAFYPVPKIFNKRVGGHEMWGAIRGAEIGDGTPEVGTIGETLQAIDLLARENDLLEMYCEMIVKNKRIGLYDGAYKSVELATGRTFTRESAGSL